MPFIKYMSNSFEQSHTNNPEELPLFLIPGILGNGSELYSLAAAINEQRNGKTPIYIYEEPINEGKPEEMPLSEHAASIAKEILEIRQNSPLPYILTGYSFGAILASEVAHVLRSVNRDPHLYVIDEPAKPCLRQCFEDHSDTFNKDLLKITNYAAKLSGMQTIQPMQGLLDAIQHMELEDRIDYLANSTLTNQEHPVSDDNASIFYTYREIAKRNLRNVIQSDSEPPQKLENIHLIFTEETTVKYDQANVAAMFTGGWDQYSDRITHLHQQAPDELAKQSHIDLLKAGNAMTVATLITESLKREITSELLMRRHLQEVLGGSLQEENMHAIIDQLFNKSQSQKRSSLQFFSMFTPPRDESTKKATGHLQAQSSTKDDLLITNKITEEAVDHTHLSLKGR